jgi:hypothetical protein
MTDKPRVPATIEDVRSPDILEWALQAHNSGKSWEFIRTELGLGTADVDRRWRELHRAIVKAEMPDNEDGSLIHLYQKQLAFQEEMMALLRTIKERVREGSKDRVIERKHKYANGGEKDLEPVVIKDTTYHHFVKMNMELLEKMMKHNQTNFDAFVTTKQSKTGKRSGVKINIYSNVPRPDYSDIEVKASDDGDDP